MEVSDDDVVEAMIDKGGSFVAGLGRLWRLADPANRAILKTAFPAYWATYTTWAELTQRQRRIK